MESASPPVPSSAHLDDRAELTAAEMVDLVRAQGATCGPEIIERIDRAIGRATDDHDLGLLYLARALSLQARGSAAAPAAAARNAVSYLVAADAMQNAALASVMAAVFLDQSGEPIAAVDHAVDALVMLGDLGMDPAQTQLEIEGVRAAHGLSGFFMRLSALDFAVDTARRAFDGALRVDDMLIDWVAFTAAYHATEAAHLTDDDTERERLADLAAAPIAWLEAHGADEISRRMLTGGLRAELRHAFGRPSDDLDLDGATYLYDNTAADIVAWHRLVRGASAHIAGMPQDAIALLDQAIPGLDASSDDHCLVRALRRRAAARAEVGDLAGAYGDASDLAERTRCWQLSQVGRLAFQLARRADLERSTTELQLTAARLAADIDQDATTGVNSRRWLERRLDELADSDGLGAALMCDIDRFKNVNDTYGHHLGDEVLCEFGRLLHDVAAGADIARFGGEEFVIVLDTGDEAVGVDVAERLRSAVEQHDWTHIAPGLRLTISCGVAHGQLNEIRSLLVAADEALLDAKQRGRNLVVAGSDAAPH